ncbi:Variant-specific surface protein [Giardia duodenalis]|uniref:Variant-specific surface protein n=1 Tax=Giardia intestinalis TaxID=5741 RepID=V6TWH1_GIAIN|nr:Variant-specific surface protein [Giardia intestinalis]
MVTLGNECILCSDAKGADGVMGVANCQTCTAPNSAPGTATCSACQEGYYKAGDACTQCNSACATCETSATQCTSCPEGKYLKGNTCAENCGGNTYYPDPVSRKCIPCGAAANEGGIEACATCEYDSTKGKPKCLTCTSSKIVKTEADGTTSCIESSTCPANGQSGDYFLSDTLTSGSKKCIACSDTTTDTENKNKGIAGCKTCTKADSATQATCSACLDGYYDSGSSTVTCTACGANCATCAKATKDQCSTCKPEYFLKTSGAPGQCFACDDVDNGGSADCQECTNAGTFKCTKCKPNYKQSGSDPVTCTKTCEDDSACGGTAGACDAIVVDGNGNMKYYCSLCGQSNYVPIDGICKVKGSNQGSDSGCSNGACQSCAANYFLYMGGCYNTQTTPGSLMCTAATNGICTAAANSRYFKVPGAASTDQSVLGCGNPLGTNTTSTNAYVGVEDCRTCTAPSEASNGAMAAAKCTACDEGTALTDSGYGCVTCSIAGCSACKADNMCEACGDGYRLEGETCVRTGGGNLSTSTIAGISVTKSSLALCG